MTVVSFKNIHRESRNLNTHLSPVILSKSFDGVNEKFEFLQNFASISYSSKVHFKAKLLKICLLILICFLKKKNVTVPGLGGNRLEAKLNKKVTPHFWCDKTTDRYFDIWFGLRHMIPIFIDCWVMCTLRFKLYSNFKMFTSIGGQYEIKL